jgi:uncharacterized lipoprotein YbaY
MRRTTSIATPILAFSAILVLTGWAARSAPAGQVARLTLKGSVSYETATALPSDSRMVVELRHVPALPAAPAVVEQRIELEGKQSPISFELGVERFKLVAGMAYVVRASIVSAKAVILVSDDVKIDVTPSEVDVKEIALKPVK